MWDKIKQHISNCLKYIEFSSVSGKKEILYCIPKDDFLFQTIHIDHYDPFKHTSYGFKHILCVIDAFTKFIRLYPCKLVTMAETIKHLQDYFRAYSIPKRLISDCGTCYTLMHFAKFLQENSNHVLIAVNTQRVNSQVECFNQIIAPMLAKFVENPCK